jgi:PAS domain S-box-containing protein
MITQTDARDALRLFDLVPTGLILMDTEGSILRINPTAERYLEAAGAELLGRDLFREVLPSLERESVGERYRRQIAAGKVELDREARVPGSRGELRVWLGIRAFRHDGAIRGIAVVEDRSALEEEEDRRRRAERLAAVGELAAGLAHEVNNPLASIRSFAQLLARDAASAEQRRALEIIGEESRRIAKVVENLLSFARQQGVGGREPVNLSAVAATVLDLQKYALDTAGIEVRKDLDHALSPVMGEAGALQQVILNLVVNAEEALASRPGHRLLIVRTRESSEGVMLSVVDNGPGIPRDQLPGIFESYRSPGSHDQGLGLEVSAKIIREHGGQIMAESEEGRGTAFFVRLPRAPVPAAPDPERISPPPEQPPQRPLRVLVADDEPTLRLAIALFLGRRGHQVVEAADAHEAFALAQEREFDVALVDVRMPGDGLELIEKLEAMPSLHGRTALMTGDMGRARTTQGIATGRPYLVKPFDMTEVVHIVERLGQ